LNPAASGQRSILLLEFTCVARRGYGFNPALEEAPQPMPKQRLAWLMVFVLLAVSVSPAFARLPSKKVAYVGGTFAAFSTSQDPVEGTFDLARQDALMMWPARKELAGMVIVIPYKLIRGLEYGQKAGRRVGAAVAGTVLLGPVGLLSLFSKKRKHFLTIEYANDAGVAQVAVFELGKDVVRTTLSVVEARSGKEIEYQDDDARKSAK
jgi:hypothetical protein